MARTAEGAALSIQHRAAQVALRAATIRDLTRLWPLFDPTDFDSFDRFSEIAATLIRARHRDSAGLAARYFETFRRLEGVSGTVPFGLAAPPTEVVTRDALRATGLLGVLNSRRAGHSIEAARQNGFVRLAGSATSLVLHGGRDTILGAVAADPQATRWQRVTSAEPCAFCAMLASRGAVYRSEETGAFEAHDHCSCMVEPAYAGSRLLPISEALRERWESATAGLSGSDALNAFRSATAGGRDDD